MPSNSSHEFSKDLKRLALEMVHRAGSSHIGGNLSMADIVAVLYNDILSIDPLEPNSPNRDRLIVSKGHAAAILYAALAKRGFFDASELETFCCDGARLGGHVTKSSLSGVEFSAGALGHGLPVGIGMAMAARKLNRSFRTFVIMSDGECDEGSVWEGALFAGHHRLSSLTAIVDYNKIQSFGTVANVLDLEPLNEKWAAFGWDVHEIDGHDHHALKTAFRPTKDNASKPRVVIAHTTKGKGVDFMEDRLEWHYKSPDKKQLEAAIRQIES